MLDWTEVLRLTVLVLVYWDVLTQMHAITIRQQLRMMALVILASLQESATATAMSLTPLAYVEVRVRQMPTRTAFATTLILV